MKGKGLLISGIAILALIAIGALSLLIPERKQPDTASAQVQPTITEITAAAQLQAPTVINVPVPTTGKIEAFHAEPGEEVYEGQLLAEVRSGGIEDAQEVGTADLERAQERVNSIESAIAAGRLEASRAAADASRVRADLDRASRFYQRQKMLLDEGATPKLTFEKAERDFKSVETESKNLDQLAKQAEERVDSLQRELDAAQKLLRDKADNLEALKESLAAGQVTSPVSGIIVGRRGELGEQVNPTVTNLFQIATDLSVMEAVAEPSAVDLAQIKPGQEAYVALAESPDELLPGVVKKVEQGKVTVEFKNPNPAIKPGLTAQVRIKLT
jgi:macrolide-specific efflux system membrane fusion protein